MRATAWIGLLLGAALGSAAAPHGALAAPSLDPGSWSGWAGQRTPLEAVFAVLGLVVTVLAWYLLVVTVLAGIGRLWGSARMVSLAEVLTLPALRGVVHAGLGLGLASSIIAGPDVARPAGAELLATSSAGVVLASAAAAPLAGGEAPAGSAVEDPVAPPVMRRLPEEAVPPIEAGRSRHWEIQPGDHLWSVAERTLADTWGMAPTDDEVAPHWRRLVQANANRLADPANPDLVFPGQVLAVPDPPPPPR